jgi:hypothetical protein
MFLVEPFFCRTFVFVIFSRIFFSYLFFVVHALPTWEMVVGTRSRWWKTCLLSHQLHRSWLFVCYRDIVPRGFLHIATGSFTGQSIAYFSHYSKSREYIFQEKQNVQQIQSAIALQWCAWPGRIGQLWRQLFLEMTTPRTNVINNYFLAFLSLNLAIVHHVQTECIWGLITVIYLFQTNVNPPHQTTSHFKYVMSFLNS